MFNMLSRNLPFSFNSIIKKCNNLNRTFLVGNKNYVYSVKKSFKIISDPKDISKLIFDDEGKCKIFEHKGG